MGASSHTIVAKQAKSYGFYLFCSFIQIELAQNNLAFCGKPIGRKIRAAPPRLRPCPP